MRTVLAEVHGWPERVKYIEKATLMKMNVRYVGTDTEISQLDIYEDNVTGEFYATML